MMPLLFMFILLISFTIFLSSNPMSMGILILSLALLSTLLFSLSMSSWLAFLIFLIYISGMLVLFSYFVAISPNLQMPTLTINMLFMITPLIIMLTWNMLPNLVPTIKQHELYVSHMYSNISTFTIIILTMILLLTMIIVVKLISMKSGPLRPFN